MRPAILVAFAVTLVACRKRVTPPVGASLFTDFTGVRAIVFGLVIAAFAMVLFWKRRAPVESRLGVGTAVAIATITLVVLLLLSVCTSGALVSAPPGDDTTKRGPHATFFALRLRDREAHESHET